MFDKGQLGKDSLLAEYNLTSNSNQCLINCYAEGNVKLFKNDKVFDGVNFKDKNGNLKSLDYKVYIKSEEDSNWKEYNYQDLSKGTYHWRIEGRKDLIENIDWIGSSFGKEFTEWAWWNSTWEKKKEIKVQDNAGSTVNNYTINLKIPYDSDMNSDYSDLRFTNGSESSELGYWIYFANSTEARVKVRIEDNLIANNNVSIYMYYGNSGASTTSDIADAHIVGEDGADFSEWTEVDGGSDITLDTTDKRVEWTDLRRDSNQQAVRRSVPELVNFTMSATYSSSNIIVPAYFGYGTSAVGKWDGATNIITEGFHGSNHIMREVTTTSTYDNSYSATNDEIYYLEMTKHGTNATAWYYTGQERQALDGTETLTIGSGTQGFDYAYMLLGFDNADPGTAGSTGWLTNYSLSKYVYPEPTYIIGVEEDSGDAIKPTYSNNAHNSTTVGSLTKFSIQYNDNTALNPNGQYIFSTNNTGTWINESAVNWTSTPEWANVTKTLNSTAGLVIGYRWFADDNADNINNTDIFTLTINKVTPSGTLSGTSPITYGTLGDVEGTESNTGDSDVNYKLYRNGTEVSNPDASTLAVGYYTYIYNSTEGANYSAVASLDTFDLTISINVGNGVLTLDNLVLNQTIYRTASILINGTLTTGEGDIYIFINDTLFDSGGSPLSNSETFNTLGYYDVNLTYLGNENYTSFGKFLYVTVIPNPLPNISIVYPLGSIYNSHITSLNYTVINGSFCWYNLNEGGGDILIACGTNVTGISSVKDLNTWTIYSNNTLGGISSDSITFDVDLPIEYSDFTRQVVQVLQMLIIFASIWVVMVTVRRIYEGDLTLGDLIFIMIKIGLGLLGLFFLGPIAIKYIISII